MTYLEFLWDADPPRPVRALGGVGILSPADIEELSAATRRVYELMRSGAWYSADDIRAAAQGSEGLRRMRELRKHVTIEKRRRSGSRLYEYRIR